MKQAVVRTSLTDQVYTFIIKKIQNASLSQGDRLNIEELSREFNVSRTPIREAINRLIQDGFVEQAHNVGPRIITFTNKQLLDLIFTNATLFTGVLESLAGTNHKDKIVSELTLSLEKQIKCLEKNMIDKYFISSIDFHKVFINNCENEKLKQLTLQTQTQCDIFVLYYLKDITNQKKSIEDHSKLLNYFIKDDFENLISFMKVHNLAAQEYFKES
ncbi:MAG: GntR family transcriptional regulator [Clostridiaceae bacterium]